MPNQVMSGQPPTPSPSDGPVLAAEVTGTTGAAPGRRMVLAHGFSQTGRAWGPFADDLAADHDVVLVDMPGHAGSSAVMADLATGAGMLGAVGGTGDYVGYSMGGRFCLHLALARPDLVTTLVLISATAGIDDPEERDRRRAADMVLADQLDPPPDPDRPMTGRRSERVARLDAFLERWLDAPMFAGIPDEALHIEQRRRNSPAGLASSLRLAGTGTQEPLWARLADLDMPVLVVTGVLDPKFTELGRRMVDAIGANADLAVVPDCGHAPQLQRPQQVARLVRAHLDGHPSPGTD